MFNHLWTHDHPCRRVHGGGPHHSRASHDHWAGSRGGPFGPRGPFGRQRMRGGGDWFGDFFGPPPRAERGGVRYLVLDVLAERERHGYEIIQAIEERSGGVYRPSPGVIYPTLQLLEELGHAKLNESDGRKVYAITDEGQSDLEAHRDEIQDFYSRFDDVAWERQLEQFGDLMRQAGRLFKTFKRAVRRGQLTPKTQARIREVMSEAVQRIDAILAEQDR